MMVRAHGCGFTMILPTMSHGIREKLFGNSSVVSLSPIII